MHLRNTNNRASVSLSSTKELRIELPYQIKQISDKGDEILFWIRHKRYKHIFLPSPEYV